MLIFVYKLCVADRRVVVGHLLLHPCFQEHHHTGLDRKCDVPAAALQVVLQGGAERRLLRP